MSSSNNFSANCRRKLRKTRLTASQVLTEHNKPVLDDKASILHNKGTTVSQDLNLAESRGQTKTRNKKDKPQAANQRAFPESPVCLRKTRKNGHVSSKSYETETFVPQTITTTTCPSKTTHKARKKKDVQPSEKKAASQACSDGLDSFNSCQEQHLNSRKTKGTRYQHSKKTHNHQTSPDVSTELHTLFPPHVNISSSHTKTPNTPRRGRPRSCPLLSSTPNSDLQPLSPKRAKNNSAPHCQQNVNKYSLAKRPRGRPRGSKKKSVQEQPSLSPPVKRSRRSAVSPVASPQEEPAVETQTPSTPCCETQEPKPKESGLHTLFPPHDKISSSHTKTPNTPKRGRPRSGPLLSSTPNSDLQPLSPKRAKNNSAPHCQQNVKKYSLAKIPPADATPSRPQRPRGRPRGSKNKNAQERPSASSPVKPQRPRGRPRGSKKKSVQEQPSLSPPVKRSRRSAVSPVESPQEEPSVETQTPSTPCCKTQRPNRKESDQTMSSDLSIELSQQEEPVPVNRSLFMHEEEEDQDDDDEEELPSFLRQDSRKPLSFSKGLCVWCKLRKFPYWPAVVKSVNHRSKKASVVFIDYLINEKRNKGFTVSLRTLKPFDCEEYEKLVHIAKEKFGSAITWSLELISDYRIRIGCGSFSGSFIEYCAADISFPVRKKYSEGKSVLTLPSQEILDECDISDNNTEDIVIEEQDELLSKKVLPDRTKAARNRANRELVDFIIRRKVEKRLLAIISGHESSKWMLALQKPCRPVVDVYLEDEEQIDKVFRYLDKVCDNAPQINTCLENIQVDRIRLILDVLLPEAIIYAISGVHKLSLEKAEEKYRKGPCFSNRERQEFDMMIEQQMKLKEITQRSDSDSPSILNHH